MYISACSSARGTWSQTGLGLRLAMEVGAHRKRTCERMSVEHELWKRAFWYWPCNSMCTHSYSQREHRSLLALDVSRSALEGLPCMITREEYVFLILLDGIAQHVPQLRYRVSYRTGGWWPVVHSSLDKCDKTSNWNLIWCPSSYCGSFPILRIFSSDSNRSIRLANRSEIGLTFPNLQNYELWPI